MSSCTISILDGKQRQFALTYEMPIQVRDVAARVCALLDISGIWDRRLVECCFGHSMMDCFGLKICDRTYTIQIEGNEDLIHDPDPKRDYMEQSRSQKKVQISYQGSFRNIRMKKGEVVDLTLSESDVKKYRATSFDPRMSAYSWIILLNCETFTGFTEGSNSLRGSRFSFITNDKELILA
jgi:hypothetical protein